MHQDSNLAEFGAEKQYSVAELLAAAAADMATAFGRIQTAARQAALEITKGETVPTSYDRLYGVYMTPYSGPVHSNLRAQFGACLLVALAAASDDTPVEVKAASGKTAAVTCKPSEVVTAATTRAAASALREVHGMASSGNKGKTGARTPIAAAAPAQPGPVLPGVTTASAIPVQLRDRWDSFGADVAAAMSDEDLRLKLIGIMFKLGYELRAKRIEEPAPLPTMPVPPASPKAVDVQDQRKTKTKTKRAAAAA